MSDIDLRKGLEFYCVDKSRARMTAERAVAHEFWHAMKYVEGGMFNNTESNAINYENKVMNQFGENRTREGHILRWVR